MTSNPFDEPDHDRTVIRPSPGGRKPVAPLPKSAGDQSRGDQSDSDQSDGDRTVIRPAPGGRRPVEPAPVPRQAVPAAPVLDVPETVALGENRLVASAQPLLQLLARLRNTATPPDAGDLLSRATAEVRRFERRARDEGVAMELLRSAHYALCASLDDVVINTPWGETAWAKASLCGAFHHETTPGAQMFDLIAAERQRAGSTPVLELFYLCLSLGFMGRLREAPRGQAEIDRLRADLLTDITAQRRPSDPGLSPHWQGIDAPYRPARAKLPLWVVASLATAVVGLLFVWTSATLNARSDALMEGILAQNPAAMPAIERAGQIPPPPPPPPPPEPSALDRLRMALKPQIDQGLSVLGTPTTPIIRLPANLLFSSTGASLLPSGAKLVDAVATALRGEPGPVLAAGYTDNQKFNSVQFPSNFQLSAARAQAVRAALGKALGDAKRVTAEGRADADPVASNATPEGREQNRRVDLVLQRKD